ncbi:4-hydroxy-tetrahydrodipicolinate synthase [Thalassotalea euphylliae]|uniref:4-hydroxy-tetrahydrodipicolinate synthase n=1 Tax=Thalassotalea euphylliae TaxID=1655234 RepID=UPI0036375401
MFEGSLVALITPFSNNGEIDFPQLAKLIEWHIKSGTSGIVIAGTTGESATLSIQEKVSLAKFTAEQVRGRTAVLAGNGSNCTRTAIELTKQLNDTGIDGLLTVTPYYNKPTPEGLYAHFTAIAKATELPIILYNVPSRTHCDMNIDVVAKLSELNNVVGIKDATADLERVALYHEKCSQPFTLLSGDDETGVEFCKLGGNGVISVTANVVPKAMADIQTLLKEQQYVEAQALDNMLSALHNNLFVESNPIPVKWAMQYLGQIAADSLRLPLTPLSEAGKTLLTPILQRLPQHLWSINESS